MLAHLLARLLAEHRNARRGEGGGKGDQLWEIAKKYKSTVDAIIEINQLAEENPRPGQKLLILK